MKIFTYPFIFFIVFALFSCSGKTPVRTEGQFNAEQSFAKANKLIDDKEYDEARNILLEIKNRDLSKKYAPLAQLRIADSYARDGEIDLAVAEYRKFLEIYPDHRHAPYAQYQIAMVYFNQIEGPERGSGAAARAIAEFKKLKKTYPRNPYRDIIELRIETARNIMADYEFLVGKFYIKKGSYDSAIGRFEPLLKNFPGYKKMDKVLFSLAEAYREIGKNDKSAEYLNRLITAYPRSPLVSDAQKEMADLGAGKK